MADAGRDPGAPPDRDTPAARRRWLLGLALILGVMVLVPGILYELARPAPLALAVAPPDPGAGDLVRSLVEGLPEALDALPAVRSVEADGAEARVVLEVRDAPGSPGERRVAVELRTVEAPVVVRRETLAAASVEALLDEVVVWVEGRLAPPAGRDESGEGGG